MASVKKSARAESTHSGRFTNLDEDKLRGGYYTSEEVATWLCSWAIRTPRECILEPSCGDGVFLRAAARRLTELGASDSSVANSLAGVEINSGEAEHARASLRELIGPRADNVIDTGDFFSWWQRRTHHTFDVVVGNPPFIRYQTFPETHRKLAMALMAEEGLAPNRLTNIWVPFVVAAVTALRPGGRLALVLPAELLQVSYAAQLRSFLADRFARIHIIACNELFFENAEQEVVLILADGALQAASETNICNVALAETRTLQEIVWRPATTLLSEVEPKTIRHDSEKWLKYFLTESEITFMRELRTCEVATQLATHATVDVGVVTGKNEFFVLTNTQVQQLGLTGHTVPLISRSIHLRGACVSKADWRAMSASGDRVYLLDLNPLRSGNIPAAVARYIRQGEESNIHKGYKCSIRDQWYEVPSIWIPDGFLFRHIYDFPRVVLNRAEATSTDNIYRLTVRAGSAERVIANTYTWLTAASAEIEGRSYGGGVLELEPTEAERLLMPATLNGALPLSECDRLTRVGRLEDALEENARTVLRGHMGLSKSDCRLLRDIWVKMRDRRIARKRSARTAPGMRRGAVRV